ncbi:hypothetical protein RBB50_000016 [Rhinocladiella similis]
MTARFNSTPESVSYGEETVNDTKYDHSPHIQHMRSRQVTSIPTTGDNRRQTSVRPRSAPAKPPRPPKEPNIKSTTASFTGSRGHPDLKFEDLMEESTTGSEVTVDDEMDDILRDLLLLDQF